MIHAVEMLRSGCACIVDWVPQRWMVSRRVSLTTVIVVTTLWLCWRLCGCVDNSVIVLRTLWLYWRLCVCVDTSVIVLTTLWLCWWLYGCVVNTDCVDNSVVVLTTLWCALILCPDVEKWVHVRCRLSPAALEGHSASVVDNSMIVFGGCSDGVPQNTLWQFDFGQSISLAMLMLVLI